MRVLHCIPHVHAGGSDIGTVALVRSLDECDDIESRLCVFQRGQVTDDRLSGLSNSLLLGFDGSHRRPDQFLTFRTTMRRIVNEWKPDIVHSHLWPACRWVSSALIGTRVSQLWHIRDTRPWLQANDITSRLLRRWTRYVLNREQPQLVAVSRAAASVSAEALGVDVSTFEVISSGVDSSRFYPRPESFGAVPVIGLAAQFRPEKGHDVLLQAVRKLRDEGLVFDLMLAGDGALLEKTRIASIELGVDNCVRFLGRVEDVPEFLSKLDLFVLPSTGFEGLPLCLLEAMAMRVPIVATAVAGTPEIIQNGTTGNLVAPNDPAALAKGIKEALTDRKGAGRMAERARELVLREHRHDIVVRRIIDLYQSLLR